MSRETDAIDGLSEGGDPDADRRLADHFGMTVRQVREFDPQTLDVTRACKFLGLPLKRFDHLAGQPGERARWVESVARQRKDLIETFPDASKEMKEMLEAIRKFALRKCLKPDGPAVVGGGRSGGQSGGPAHGRTRLLVWGGVFAVLVIAGGVVALFVSKQGASDQQETSQAGGASRLPFVAGKKASDGPANQPVPVLEQPATEPSAAPNPAATKAVDAPSPASGAGVQEVISFAGKWSGPYSDARGGKGNGDMIVMEDRNGAFSGTWDTLEFKGKRVNNNTIEIIATSSKYTYVLTCTVQNEKMSIKYVAKRPNGEFVTDGKGTLKRVGLIVIRSKEKLVPETVVTVELDGKRVAEWPKDALELRVDARPGRHRVVVRSAYMGVFYSQAFDAVVVKGDADVILQPDKLNADLPQRVKWVHPAGSFNYLGDGKWVEANAQGIRSFSFHEVARVSDYVELHDASRNCSVRLLAGSMHLKGFKGYPEFKEYYVGRWDK